MNNEPKPSTPTTEVQELPFPTPSDQNGYQIFPDAWENDPNIFFHGTEDRVRQSILGEGFRFPPLGKAQSVSFSRTSDLALGYACRMRSAASPEGVVLAVKFGSGNRSVARSEHFGLHVDRFDPQPEIIGYIVVPAAYVHR